jgi:hypothetical protein
MHLASFRRAAALSAKIVRLSTFCAAVGVAAGSLVTRSVYGSVTDSVAQLGQEWARRSGAVDRDTYRVRINGEALMISSRMTERSVHDVLEDAEGECRARSGGVDQDVAKMALAKVASWMFGVVRHEGNDSGFVACIERDGQEGLASLVRRLHDAAQSGDIARLGTLRYTIADRAPGATKTHVLHEWTEGHFNVRRMFPPQGDVPGTDLPEVHRPAGARRVLDASMDGAGFGLRVYEAPGTAASILEQYDRDLAASGWSAIKLPGEDGATRRVFDRGATDMFIRAEPSGDRTLVSLTTLPPNQPHLNQSAANRAP